MQDQLQYCTFRLGGTEFAIEVHGVQEVLRGCTWTPVPRAPAAVLGLMNLRGQIVTVIDLASWLKLAPRADRATACTIRRSFNIVLAGATPPLSLAVDEVGDVLTFGAGEIEEPPATLDSSARARLRGVYMSKARLISVLETGALLEWGKAENANAV